MRIQDNILKSIVYFYPDQDAAEKGSKSGACGFAVSIPSKKYPNITYQYIISNAHVAKHSKVLRTNSDSGMVISPINENLWIFHPIDDVAAIPLTSIKAIDKTPYSWNYNSVPINQFLTKELMIKNNIGHGNKTFMVGRFSIYSGKEKNLPVARFGNISMIPDSDELIEDGRGIRVEAFVVELRSRNGFSGSPTFIYTEPFDKRSPKERTISTNTFEYLLGIDSGHFNHHISVLSEITGKPIEDYIVNVSTGMTLVVPAWKILELLEGDQITAQMKSNDENHSSL